MTIGNHQIAATEMCLVFQQPEIQTQQIDQNYMTIKKT